jgi:hypothetical protein
LENKGVLSRNDLEKMSKYIEWLPEMTNEELFEYFNLSGTSEHILIEDFISVYEHKFKIFQKNEEQLLKSPRMLNDTISMHRKMLNLIAKDVNDINPNLLIQSWKRDGNIHSLIKIYSNLRTLPFGWISEFLELDGYNTIVNALLNSNILSKLRSKKDLIIETICIGCIYALIQTQIGISLFLKEKECINTLMTIFGQSTTSTKNLSRIALILSIVCSYGKNAYEFINQSFEYLRVIKNEKIKFSTIINMLGRINDQETSTNIFLVLNELLIGAPDPITLHKIQRDFKNLNLMKICEVQKII